MRRKGKKGNYVLTLATANRSEELPMREFLGSTSADIVFGQEVHAAGDKFGKFKADGKLAGWKILGSEAQATGRGGNSGGVVIAARSRIGMGFCPGFDSAEIVPGRLTAVHLATLAKGGVVGVGGLFLLI